MKTKNEIKAILMGLLDSVYCNTCVDQVYGERCDECKRKSMNWSISEEFAERLAEMILSE